MKSRIVILAGLIFISLVLLWKSQLQPALLPFAESPFQLIAVTSSDREEGGNSTIFLAGNNKNEIHVRYTLSSNIQFPYASLGILLNSVKHSDAYTDLSALSTLSFSIECNTKNILVFSLYTFDHEVTKLQDFNTLRPAMTSFVCHKEKTQINIALDKLEVPEWWLKRNNRELTDNAYTLDKVYSFAIVNSSQSPLEQESSYIITRMRLKGTSTGYLFAAYGFAGGIVLLLIYWGSGLHKNRLLPVPVMRYTEVKLDVKKGRDIKAILEFMGANYANPDLSLEFLGSSLGVNRTKINDLLKAHTGLTFSAYLNKLRLTEAARLLTENGEANISETAYAVGYRHISYFNTLFKKEFGCTPNSYKKRVRE